jgi:hypothetical protein
MNNFLKKLKGIKRRDAMYPGIVVVFVALVAVCFTLVAQFLAQNLNKALVIDEQSIDETLVRVDLADYYLVAKKAGINIGVPAPEAPQTPAAPTPMPPSSAPSGESGSTTISSSSPLVSKNSLRIEVVNGSSRQGVATDLKNDLVSAGFTTVLLNSTPNQEPVTIISLKKSRVSDGLIAELKQVVSQKYDLGEIGTLAETEAFDARIVIGNK